MSGRRTRTSLNGVFIGTPMGEQEGPIPMETGAPETEEGTEQSLYKQTSTGQAKRD